LHVLRHVDGHGAGAAGLGDLKCQRHHLQQLVDVAHEEVVLGDREREAVGIHFLERIGADQRLRHLAGDGHERH